MFIKSPTVSGSPWGDHYNWEELSEEEGQAFTLDILGEAARNHCRIFAKHAFANYGHDAPNFQLDTLERSVLRGAVTLVGICQMPVEKIGYILAIAGEGAINGWITSAHFDSADWARLGAKSRKAYSEQFRRIARGITRKTLRHMFGYSQAKRRMNWAVGYWRWLGKDPGGARAYLSTAP